MDTGAWVALADRDDQHHRAAARIYPRLLRESKRLVTTNLVVAESYTLLRRALGHEPAIAFLERMHSSPRIERVYSTSELETEAAGILRNYKDQDFSYADAVSFALMGLRGIDTAFAFDRHFATAGFILLPSQ